MTSEKKSLLLGQLQEAIDEAVKDSPRIGEIVEQLRNYGFDLNLMLESTVTISPIAGYQADSVAQSPLADGSNIELTDEDRAFLRGLKVAA